MGKDLAFAGGDVIRPHLLTTAIGHGVVAAEGIDRFLAGEAAGKRPKVDVRAFDLLRKFEELSFPEIARRLSKSEDACRMQFARAMTALTLALGSPAHS